eukprot:TRINITY_DN9065_c0_g1_i1.p1 TRINITY_DN9065_c0_g1~~TRINITY_DN9065_c0_g1_i1.p1  ORF type:complete len:627 (+),score=110.70 TRINITY_DN9065_c0_g1_i1:87-1967(+)
MAKIQKVGRELPVHATIERFEVVGDGSSGDVLSSALDVVKARVSLVKSGQHVDYIIRVMLEGQSWLVTKRFNEFATLSDVLKKRLASVPEMPAKSVVRQFSPEYLEARKCGLTAFLRELCRRRDATNCREFQDFLLLRQRVPALSQLDSSEPVQAAEVQEASFGIADFDYDPVQGMLLMGSSDFSWTSRVDTKITNIKMPWEKKSPNLPSSQMSLWQQSPAELKFEMQSMSRFTALTSCVLLINCRDKAVCLAGLSDGTIGCHPLRSERKAGGSGASVLPLVRHTSAVVALALDEIEQWLFSASSDKAIIVFDLRRSMIQCEVQAPAAVTKMQLCQEQRRLFTALKNGTVVIWDASVLPMQRMATVPDGASGNPITAMDYDPSSGTLFTASKEGIQLWTVKTSDGGGWGRKLGQITDMSSPPTALAWAPSSREIIAGFANGAVVIFDLDQGGPSYAIAAHADGVSAVRWLDAPRRLLTAAKDKTLKIWDFPSLERAPLDANSWTAASMQSQSNSYDQTRTRSTTSSGLHAADPPFGRASAPIDYSGGYGNPLSAPGPSAQGKASYTGNPTGPRDPHCDPHTGEPATLRASGLSGAVPVPRDNVVGRPPSAALANDDSDDDLAGWNR